jgi:GH15 family glucan-1,4-alpha-glucosidase
VTYHPISDYAVIGDLHGAALVGRHGAVDWLCIPRFDSPSVFGALLDARRGGCWSIAPLAPFTSEQRYLPGTNVLVTAFRLEQGGVLEVTDFMPVGPSRARYAELHRRVRCTRGTVEVEVAVAPRFGYGANVPTLHARKSGILATDDDDDVVTIASPAGVSWALDQGRASARLSLGADEHVWFVLRGDDDEVHPLADYRSQEKLDATAQWWDAWSSQLDYHGPFRQEVERSALALKLCCYDPTGAIVAAPTTSLPETMGGARNWDYRFVWLRDAAFVLFAFGYLGARLESDAFLAFLKRVTRRADGRHLQIMYTVDGDRRLPEQILDQLEGYAGSQPVRVGNAAAGQFQLDVYGEMLETAYLWHGSRAVTEGLWKTMRQLVSWTADHWREPDSSIWEPRGDAKHYVFSKVLAWVALDRGARMADTLGLPGDIQRWRAEAAAVRAEVCERGWDASRGTFVQVYGEPQLDAGALFMPLVQFLERDDPRVRSTLAAVRRELASPCEELIYRYRSPDGFPGEEGAFLICSFWMIQNLALLGEIDEAERLFRLLVRRASPTGLLAEQIDPRNGAQLGNYPLGLSHASLINTAVMLQRARAPD